MLQSSPVQNHHSGHSAASLHPHWHPVVSGIQGKLSRCRDDGLCNGLEPLLPRSWCKGTFHLTSFCPRSLLTFLFHRVLNPAGLIVGSLGPPAVQTSFLSGKERSPPWSVGVWSVPEKSRPLHLEDSRRAPHPALLSSCFCPPPTLRPLDFWIVTAKFSI